MAGEVAWYNMILLSVMGTRLACARVLELKPAHICV